MSSELFHPEWVPCSQVHCEKIDSPSGAFSGTMTAWDNHLVFADSLETRIVIPWSAVASFSIPEDHVVIVNYVLNSEQFEARVQCTSDYNKFRWIMQLKRQGVSDGRLPVARIDFRVQQSFPDT